MSTQFIGVTGTHSTGKTTFINNAAAQLRNSQLKVSVVTDLASMAVQKGFPILHNHNEESTLWLITHGISKELEQSLINDIVIVDRPVVDAIGYYLAAMEITNRSINRSYLDLLFCMASEWLKRYSLICKMRLNTGIPLGADRDTDHNFRVLADNKINEALMHIGIDFVEISDSSSNDYLKQIASHFARTSNCDGL